MKNSIDICKFSILQSVEFLLELSLFVFLNKHNFSGNNIMIFLLELGLQRGDNVPRRGNCDLDSFLNLGSWCCQD